MNIEDLPKEIQFLFCTVMMAAVKARREDMSEEKFCEFCKGCYESAGLSDLDYLTNILSGYMIRDMLNNIVEN